MAALEPAGSTRQSTAAALAVRKHCLSRPGDATAPRKKPREYLRCGGAPDAAPRLDAPAFLGNRSAHPMAGRCTSGPKDPGTGRALGNCNASGVSFRTLRARQFGPRELWAAVRRIHCNPPGCRQRCAACMALRKMFHVEHRRSVARGRKAICLIEGATRPAAWSVSRETISAEMRATGQAVPRRLKPCPARPSPETVSRETLAVLRRLGQEPVSAAGFQSLRVAGGMRREKGPMFQ